MLESVFIPIASFIVIAFFVVAIGKSMYKIPLTNEAMVVTGPFGSKTVIGKGCFVIPIIQKCGTMSLENIQADFTSRDEIPTKDAINILVDAVANVSISQDPELLKIASSKFLGYSIHDIRQIITPVLEGNIREIISQTTLKELIQGDKKVFAEKVAENVAPNLRDMGLELTTFNIQNFKDNNGVIKNLGIENTVQISKDAQKAKAAAEAEIAVAQAEAEKAANDAYIKSQTEIALKNNEFEIKKAELKKAADIKKAEADAAYKIQREEQRKTEEITTANANLAKQEKEIELKEREVSIKERTLEAEVKKEAEARKYAAQQAADARLYEVQKAADAELFERQRRAEAEKFEILQQAEAEKFDVVQKAEALKAESEAKKVAMENEAAGIEAKGKAEASAIQAKALAEAEGILKKAEAMKQYGEAAMADMQLEVSKAYIAQLPAIMAAAGQAYTNVDAIYMYGGDTSKLTGDIMTNVTQVSEGLSKSLGIDLSQIANSFLGAKMAQPNE